ncbi:uncharacterized protein JCM6883_007601 [Sporobolomyces salmoneus]|uniref:uncharacterized protein n=1 Tax=Sporobolomyces salmoneus TaxID=183962 RepID=UPI00317765B8
MQRYTSQLLLLQRQSSVRYLSTSSPLLSKASKDRSSRKPKSFSSPSPSTAAAGGAYASAPAPGQAGTDVGKSGGSGNALFEGGAEENPVTPETIEKEFTKHQKEDDMTDEKRARENQAGTDVAQGGLGDAGIQNDASTVASAPAEEVIYTTTPPYNVPLIMSAAFVVGVFCFVTADLARVGIAVYNEETGEHEVAPKWKRYTLAIGAAGVGTAAVAWGTLAPSRLVTKMTLHRTPASRNSSLPFPPDSIVSIHSPLTRLASKFGQKPRQVELRKIQLLGPLSEGPKPYHPLIRPQNNNKKEGKISSFLSQFFPAPSSRSSSSKAPTPWSKSGKKLSHSPILIEGDRASYSIALKRAREMNSEKGAWCKDWDALERALLKVDERKWAK